MSRTLRLAIFALVASLVLSGAALAAESPEPQPPRFRTLERLIHKFSDQAALRRAARKPVYMSSR